MSKQVLNLVGFLGFTAIVAALEVSGFTHVGMWTLVGLWGLVTIFANNND